MEKKLSKGTLMAALICGSIVPVLMGTSGVYAAEAEDDALSSFTLDPMVITATRTEKRDVDVPAATEILSNEQIVASGATNAFDALRHVNGIDVNNYFPGGAPMTTMTSDINIRGYGDGTLVMLNGNPVNLNNKYVIDAIPTESIERVEIVKGGGSVLYGSEAMGGVVNIITKKKGSNYVTVGGGNYGQRKASVGVGNEKFHVNYDFKRWGRVEDLSVSTRPTNVHKDTKISKGKYAGETYESGTYDYNLVKNEKKSLDIGYNITDKLSLGFNHWESDVNYRADWTSDNTLRNWRNTYTKENMIQLNYNDDNFKGHAWYNENNISYAGYDSYTSSTTDGDGDTKPVPAKFTGRTQQKNKTFGIDLQKDVRLNSKALLTIGTDFKYEQLHKVLSSGKPVKTNPEMSRNTYALFAQLDQKLGEKDSIILGGRGTWTTGGWNNQNYHNFSGSFQYMHKFNENQGLYAKAAQSFIMPSFSQMSPSGLLGGLENPDLKPQKGTNYELGYKAVTGGKYTWKAALFHMKVKDNITATVGEKDGSGNITYKYSNVDFKNTGFEASVDAKESDHLNWNFGFTVSKPQFNSTAVSAKTGKLVKPGWQRKYSGFQIKAGIDYHISKFRTSFSCSYVGDRWMSPSSSASYKTDPYFLTSWTASYAPTKNHEINLIVDNVFDRRDNISNTMSGNGAYFTTGRNYLLSYTYKF